MNRDKHRILGLFSNFEAAFNVIADIRYFKVPGVALDDVTVISPIEHPEIDEILGERPSPVPKFALAGALFGAIFGFLFLASAQANFLVQPQGGKPVIPLPPNITLAYEMLILFGVLFMLTGFMIAARMIKKRNTLYSDKVSLDQIGIELEVKEDQMASVKKLFKKHGVLEVREEVIQ